MMRKHFPTTALLAEAPVFDVAGVILELFAERADGSRHNPPSNSITSWVEEYSQRDRDQVRHVLSEAWAWLQYNGFIANDLRQGGGPDSAFVTRQGHGIKSRSDFLAYAKESLLPKEMLRGDLADIVRPLFLGGHFAQAASAALLQVELFVRKACDYPDDLVGVKLMRKAFDPENGPLTDPEATRGEQQGASDLFAGAMGYYRNPLAHGRVGISHAVQAASIILLANELLVVADIHAGLRRGIGP